MPGTFRVFTHLIIRNNSNYLFTIPHFTDEKIVTVRSEKLGTNTAKTWQIWDLNLDSLVLESEFSVILPLIYVHRNQPVIIF